jgi:hypothetical protein
MRNLLAAVAMVFAAACSDSVSPGTIPFQLSFTTPPSASYPGPQITTAANLVGITARLIAPTPCTDVSAAVNHHDASIDVIVTATQRNVTCVQSLGVFDYTLVLSPVTAGTYHVTVQHVGEAGGANTAFAQDVTVP